MRKDDHLIFEALQNKGVVVHIADHVVNEKESTAGKQRLKYDYEWATAFLPRDIDISNKAGQDKVLSLAYDEVLKRIVHDRKNPRLAARNMFYDEDFPMEIVSQYAHYQKHGFPDASEDGWYASENAEDAENASHGYPGGITAIQNVLINQLKKHGFHLNKVSHANAEPDGYPTVFMGRKQGPMHNVVEISPMGEINGEHYKDYLAGLKDADAEKNKRASGIRPDPEDPYYDTWQSIAQDHAEDAESAFHYDAMESLSKAANEIRDILQGAANDEARTEHIIKMAQIILGSPKDYHPAEYRKMLDGLIVLLNRFIVVPMN